jgi:hypothetical protein
MSDYEAPLSYIYETLMGVPGDISKNYPFIVINAVINMAEGWLNDMIPPQEGGVWPNRVLTSITHGIAETGRLGAYFGSPSA